jgi:hypothetical protein
MINSQDGIHDDIVMDHAAALVLIGGGIVNWHLRWRSPATQNNVVRYSSLH